MIEFLTQQLQVFLDIFSVRGYLARPAFGADIFYVFWLGQNSAFGRLTARMLAVAYCFLMRDSYLRGSDRFCAGWSP